MRKVGLWVQFHASPADSGTSVNQIKTSKVLHFPPPNRVHCLHLKPLKDRICSKTGMKN